MSKGLLPARRLYRKDIIWVIVLKLFALIAIWALFFSAPVKDKLTKQIIQRHYRY